MHVFSKVTPTPSNELAIGNVAKPSEKIIISTVKSAVQFRQSPDFSLQKPNSNTKLKQFQTAPMAEL